MTTLDDIDSGNIKPEKQDDAKATYAEKITKQDGKINFDMEPVELARRAKAFDSWPGLYCDYGDKVMKIWSCQPDEKEYEGQNGEILKVKDEGFLVRAGGKGLWVTEIQMPGKKRVKVSEFLKGNKIEEGLILK